MSVGAAKRESSASQTESAVEEGCGGARSAEQRKRWRVQNRAEQCRVDQISAE